MFRNTTGTPSAATVGWLVALCVSPGLLPLNLFGQAPPAMDAPQQTLVEAQPQDIFEYAPVRTKSTDVWNPLATDRLAGSIEEFNDQTIIFIENGARRELPSHRVLSIQPVWKSEAAVAAHRLFTERRYQSAIEAIPQAVKSNIPRWQQRLLIAELIDAAVATGSLKGACSVFLDSLAPNQPPAMLYSSLPLCWTTEEPDRLVRQAAVDWLASSSEAAQLLGASWLLLGADGQAAQRKLRQLQGSKTEPISALAVAQAWRLATPTETETNLAAWFEYRDRMLEPLQLGPTEFLADRLSRIGKIELAVGQWARIASVHAGRYHRASKALLAAQQRLQEQGRTEEAKRLQAWIEQLQPVTTK